MLFFQIFFPPFQGGPLIFTEGVTILDWLAWDDCQLIQVTFDLLEIKAGQDKSSVYLPCHATSIY